ncbi:MAG: PQQ-binding-like beta-propeller repeat protein [Acidimicrobiales bacterium]|jgi:polyvinyl alcohol dehydrogenase (cytochrome)
MGMSIGLHARRRIGASSRPWVWVVLVLLGLSVPMTMVPSATASGATASSASTSESSGWTVYHQDAAGTGVATSVTGVDTSTPRWTSPRLDGQIYGEPLAFSGRVFVATENDTVYALASSTGAVVWSVHLGTPVPSGSLPCGDISPTVGVTGTPVIDPARSEIFMVADELINAGPAHMLVGLDTASGQIELTQNVDPPGAAPRALLQRTGLTLDGGEVVFGFGGNYGDCSTYRGWLVAVAEDGGTPSDFAVDAAPGESQGAIWMGGAAPAVDSGGNLWIAAGNGSVTSPGHAYDFSDSVLELSSRLLLLQYFAPGSWASDNAHDLDMSMEPALLADGRVVEAGKSRTAYLLDVGHLGGIGGQEVTLGHVCDEDVDGGSAVVGTTVFLPCLSGTVALQVGSAPPALRVLWTSMEGGGPPIVAGGLVWTIGQNGTLYGLDSADGAVLQKASVGVPANHFPTPSVGDGLLLAPSAYRVVAFTASSTGASGQTSSSVARAGPTATTAASAGKASEAAVHAGHGAGAIAGVIGVGVVAAGLAVWFLARRRGRRAA